MLCADFFDQKIMKYLLLIAFVVFVSWMLRRPRIGGSRSGAQRRSAADDTPEQMVKCAHCGVNQPISESILTHGRYYCCNAHRLESEAMDR